MSDDEILEVQRLAVEAGDWELLCDTYSALDYSRRYAFLPVTPEERERGRRACERAAPPRAP